MAQYDPKIIQKYASKLYSYANQIIFVYALVGGLAGFFLGLAFINGLVASDTRLILRLVAMAIGALIGFSIGSQRAFWYKLQAQLALCQMTIEANTRRASTQSPAYAGGFPNITE